MLLATALLLLGCSLDVQQPRSFRWEGSLQPTGEGTSLTGSAAAISRESTTDVGLQVTGGDVGDRWRWSLREGTCDSPGPVVSDPDDYPVIEAAEETDTDAPSPVVRATGETVLATTLDAGGSYHATVAADSAPDVLLACGDLGRV